MKIYKYNNDGYYIASYHGIIAYGYGRMQAISNMLGIIQMQIWNLKEKMK
jgi:hypothetical protein